MKIITDESILRKETQKISLVEMKNINKLIKDMTLIMKKNDGCGLAAPQVGVNKKLFVADLTTGIKTFINPEIIEHSLETEKKFEGCLSIPHKSGLVSRYTWVKLKYFNGQKIVTEVYKGFNARVIQHEYDHLEKKLYIDIASQIIEEK